MDKTTYFKQNPIKTKPFMFKEELDAMSLYAEDIKYELSKEDLQKAIDNAPTAEEYWGKDYNNKKNK